MMKNIEPFYPNAWKILLIVSLIIVFFGADDMVGGASDLQNGETVFMHGTHRGLFMGNPPTNRQVEVQGMIFGRIENGRIVEDWTLIDQIGILQQLGLVPPAR